MQQTGTCKAVVWRIEALKLLSYRVLFKRCQRIFDAELGMSSGIATRGQRGQSASLTEKKLSKRGENW